MKASVLCRLMSVVALCGLCAAGCSKKEPEPENPTAEEYVFEPVRIASAYTALLEKPDAECALLIGEEAKRLTNYFGHAGIETHLTAQGIFDIVVVACGEMSIESCEKLCGYVSNGGIVAWIMDVKEVNMAQFRKMIDSFKLEGVHLWMPGAERWLLVGRKNAQPVQSSAMLDLFAREGTYADLSVGGCGTVPEMFANYAGTKADILPAFEGCDMTVTVRPELFLTKDIPTIDWVTYSDEDEDIAKNLKAEMRSMQVVRRLVVEGNILSHKAKDKDGEAAAIEKWAAAVKRNPHDLFVLERLDRLDRNARGFIEVGKVLMAMKCYETMLLIRPSDASAVHNFGMCLKKIGKLDVAEKVLKRAETLLKAQPQPQNL